MSLEESRSPRAASSASAGRRVDDDGGGGGGKRGSRQPRSHRSTRPPSAPCVTPSGQPPPLSLRLSLFFFFTSFLSLFFPFSHSPTIYTCSLLP
ncbi:hypothetical protein PUN28_017490 [Cardiocondyla obscurior]|uniref:Uncharacterized protein n=1 Tax=Cardiocondyla obscurior TaxID=286306 RepID=A0AAW2EM93_9HYME